ncbi:MAG: helicase HerA-like domain-containing protein [Gemmatimonadaceae bacterium]
MDPRVLESARSSFASGHPAITLGALVHDGACHPEPVVRIPLPMMNRHGLIAGATGTGKTKSLQLIAEQLSAQGVPVFVADLKGDVSGIAVAGDSSERVVTRARDTGYDWHAMGFPVEFLSLTGSNGAQLRATVSSFGPLLLAKVLELNETQSSVLSMVFKYCDDQGLLLLDLNDLRAALQFLAEDGADELKAYGGMSKATVGVLLREMVELEQQGAEKFFGEPAFDLDDLLQVERDGRGLVSVLELQDVQQRPALFSTFMLWMLATLYNELPEVGDIDKPKLVFFFDEAHLLFKDASDALLDQIEQVVRLIRSKGVGVFFITQSPKDIPDTVLAQLGNRVQHALRAFTPDDEKDLRAASRTFPKTDFYDVQATLTSLGIGEAMVVTLRLTGAPTPPFISRMIPPSSRMGPLTDAERTPRLATPQVRKYAQAIDRESAREMLAARHAAEDSAAQRAEADAAPPARAPRGRSAREAPAGGALAQILGSSIGKSVLRTAAVAVTGTLIRGVLGALVGSKRRRR